MASTSTNSSHDVDERPFEFWYAYSDLNLRQLCINYGLPTSGGKKQKAARLAVAWENGVQPIASTKVSEEIREKELAAKFDRPLFSISNPTTIRNELWTRGNDAVARFPLIDRQSILKYFLKEPFATHDDKSGGLAGFNK